MTIQNAAAGLLIILPAAFNLFFFLLARRFSESAGTPLAAGRGRCGL